MEIEEIKDPQFIWKIQSQATNLDFLCTPCLARWFVMWLLSRKEWVKVIDPKHEANLLAS